MSSRGALYSTTCPANLVAEAGGIEPQCGSALDGSKPESRSNLATASEEGRGVVPPLTP
jgi:hypothetical protein